MKANNIYFGTIGKEEYWKNVAGYLNSISNEEKGNSSKMTIVTKQGEEIYVQAVPQKIGEEFYLSISGKNLFRQTKNELERIIN